MRFWCVCLHVYACVSVCLPLQQQQQRSTTACTPGSHSALMLSFKLYVCGCARQLGGRCAARQSWSQCGHSIQRCEYKCVCVCLNVCACVVSLRMLMSQIIFTAPLPVSNHYYGSTSSTIKTLRSHSHPALDRLLYCRWKRCCKNALLSLAKPMRKKFESTPKLPRAMERPFNNECEISYRKRSSTSLSLRLASPRCKCRDFNFNIWGGGGGFGVCVGAIMTLCHALCMYSG